MLTTYFDTPFTVHSFINSSLTFLYGISGRQEDGRQQILLIWFFFYQSLWFQPPS